MAEESPHRTTVLNENAAHQLNSGEFTRSAVSDVVFDAMLEAIYDGRLPQGSKISDLDLAKELGVSRTPVREAIQRMREIGLIETAPNRFTRVMTVDGKMLRDALVVWEGLYTVLLAGLVENTPEATLEQMESVHDAFQRAVVDGDAREAALQNFIFFTQPVLLARNPFLRSSIDSVVHIIRLGGVSLPEWIDTDSLHGAQRSLLDALRRGDLVTARAAAHAAAQAGLLTPSVRAASGLPEIPPAGIAEPSPAEPRASD